MRRLAALALAACAAHGPTQVVGRQLPERLEPSPLQLASDVVPLAQSLELSLTFDPNLLEGTTVIRLRVTRPVRGFWLHGATNLGIDWARLDGVEVFTHSGGDYLAIVPATPIAAGEAELTIHWRTMFPVDKRYGIVGGSRRAFTNLEPIGARLIFPCFDEPRFKIPWRVTLRYPADLFAASNGPVAESVIHGRQRVTRFAATPPIPSYLVAFLVGDFHAVEEASAGAPPIRILVAAGSDGLVDYALRTSRLILRELEGYTGLPHPFAKLDQVAFPDYPVGGMENAGLVGYAAAWLTRPGFVAESVSARSDWLEIGSHELAHQWFGNLVTMTWWDDVWLNEGFASWMGAKIALRVEQPMDRLPSRLEERRALLRRDALRVTRRLRQPVSSDEQIRAMFDHFTYKKGQAILEMFEAWVGEEVFRRGIQHYLGRYAGGNATADEAMAAIAEGAGRPELAAAMRTFVDQAGVPVVGAEVDCAGSPAVRLHQERFLADGTHDRDAAVWQIPVCFRTEAGRACQLLTEPTATFPLRSCPRWLLVDADGAGYYRATYAEPQLEALFTAWSALSLAEQDGLLDDVHADLLRGGLVAGDLVRALRRSQILRTLDHPQLSVLLDHLGVIARHAGGEDAFSRLVVDELGPRARALGWRDVPGESRERTDQRLWLVPLVALAGDPILARELPALYRAVLGGRGDGLSEAAMEAVLRLSAAQPDVDARPLLAATRVGHPAGIPLTALRALAELRDPALRGEIRAALAGRTRTARARVLFRWLTVPAWRDEALALLTEPQTELDEDMPELDAIQRLCDRQARDRVAAAFLPFASARPARAERLVAALSRMDACIAALPRHRASLRQTQR